MGKQVNQGTRWESRIVNRLILKGREAMRLPKTGKKNEPDILVIPKAGMIDADTSAFRLAVAWERWNGKKKDGRRRATRMFAIPEETFYELLDRSEFGWYIQAKSTQAGSLSTWLEGLAERIEQDEN
jgi:hypothetical protein